VWLQPCQRISVLTFTLLRVRRVRPVVCLHEPKLQRALTQGSVARRLFSLSLHDSWGHGSARSYSLRLIHTDFWHFKKKMWHDTRHAMEFMAFLSHVIPGPHSFYALLRFVSMYIPVGLEKKNYHKPSIQGFPFLVSWCRPTLAHTHTVCHWELETDEIETWDCEKTAEGMLPVDFPGLPL
jgi:hypothetical protein